MLKVLWIKLLNIRLKLYKWSREEGSIIRAKKKCVKGSKKLTLKDDFKPP